MGGFRPEGPVTERPAGFVLVGGNSRRMGQNKALLPWNQRPLAQHMAELLSAVANPVSLIGPVALYKHLGYTTFADLAFGRGPLSGMEAGLRSPNAREWNLFLACDMPCVETGLLRQLADEVQQLPPEVECLVPAFEGKLQPLCALYRRSCAAKASHALDQGQRRVVDFIETLHSVKHPVENAHPFRNVNTPAEWDDLLAAALLPQPDDRRVPPLP